MTTPPLSPLRQAGDFIYVSGITASAEISQGTCQQGIVAETDVVCRKLGDLIRPHGATMDGVQGRGVSGGR